MMITKDNIKKLKVSELREALRSLNMDIAGSKVALVLRLEAAIDSNKNGLEVPIQKASTNTTAAAATTTAAPTSNDNNHAPLVLPDDNRKLNKSNCELLMPEDDDDDSELLFGGVDKLEAAKFRDSGNVVAEVEKAQGTVVSDDGCHVQAVKNVNEEPLSSNKVMKSEDMKSVVEKKDKSNVNKKEDRMDILQQYKMFNNSHNHMESNLKRKVMETPKQQFQTVAMAMAAGQPPVTNHNDSNIVHEKAIDSATESGEILDVQEVCNNNATDTTSFINKKAKHEPIVYKIEKKAIPLTSSQISGFGQNTKFMSEEEKKIMRAKRFGLKVPADDKSTMEKRALKFGVKSNDSPVAAISNIRTFSAGDTRNAMTEEEKRKARAIRFGLNK